MIAAAIKKDCSYRKNCYIRLHDGDLKHSLMKEKKIDLHVFFPFSCSVIPDLDLEILKMLIRVCFSNVLQTASLYSKCTVFTVNLVSISYVQEKC